MRREEIGVSDRTSRIGPSADTYGSYVVNTGQNLEIGTGEMLEF